MFVNNSSVTSDVHTGYSSHTSRSLHDIIITILVCSTIPTVDFEGERALSFSNNNIQQFTKGRLFAYWYAAVIEPQPCLLGSSLMTVDVLVDIYSELQLTWSWLSVWQTHDPSRSRSRWRAAAGAARGRGRGARGRRGAPRWPARTRAPPAPTCARCPLCNKRRVRLARGARGGVCPQVVLTCIRGAPGSAHTSRAGRRRDPAAIRTAPSCATPAWLAS